MLIKAIINIFMNFHTNRFFKYFDKNLDKYPREKKNKNDAIAVPKPK